MTAPAPGAMEQAVPRKALTWEILVVLGISLGQSAIRAVVSIIERMTRPEPLATQTTRMNTSTTPDRPWLDLIYQVMNTAFPLMPVVLVLFLLYIHHRPAGGPFAAMGFDFRKAGRDWLQGLGIFVGIGVAGLAFYLFAREIGINTNVVPANLAAAWWTILILLARALMNGILEEVVMVGYLFARWKQLGRRMWEIVVISAIIRGCYHLYQGWGGFIGNLVMGLAFGWLYLRIKRVMPLVIVHTLLDVFAFVGYALLSPYLTWL